jgi:FkbM family methyltransferase
MTAETSAAARFVTGASPIIFDVGANVGAWSAELAHYLGERGRFFLFEPQAYCHASYPALDLPEAVYIRAAFFSDEGEAELRKDREGSGVASLYERHDTYLAKQTSTEWVPTVTVDGEMARLGLERVDLIKLDVEGSERSVLEGASGALKSGALHTIAFEFGSANVYSRTFFRDLWCILNEHGYRLWRICPGGALLPIPEYREDLENFRGATNYIASLRSPSSKGRRLPSQSNQARHERSATLFRLSVPRHTLRRANRLRFLAKYRLLRHAGATVRKRPRSFFGFLFGDELHSFSYQIANEDALAVALSTPLGTEAPAVHRLFAEGRDFFSQCAVGRRDNTQLSARHLSWYALVRHLKPRLVVESGVDCGRGSLVMLTALQANRREGSGGELISIDPQVGAGYLVPPEMRIEWRLVRGRSKDAVTTELLENPIDIYFHDSRPDLAAIEFRAAVAHSAPRFVFASSWNTDALRQEFTEHDAAVVSFAEAAIHPVFRGGNLLFGFIGKRNPRSPRPTELSERFARRET